MPAKECDETDDSVSTESETEVEMKNEVIDEPEPEPEEEKRGPGRPLGERAKRYKKASPGDKRLEKKEVRPRTQKQIDAFKRCREAAARARELRKKEDDEEVKKVVKKRAEEAVVRRAIKIKKKEEIRKAVLDDVSSESDDSDIEIQAVKKYVKRKQAKRKAKGEPVSKKVEKPQLSGPVYTKPEYFFV